MAMQEAVLAAGTQPFIWAQNECSVRDGCTGQGWYTTIHRTRGSAGKGMVAQCRAGTQPFIGLEGVLGKEWLHRAGLVHNHSLD